MGRWPRQKMSVVWVMCNDTKIIPTDFVEAVVESEIREVKLWSKKHYIAHIQFESYLYSSNILWRNVTCLNKYFSKKNFSFMGYNIFENYYY